MHHGSRSRTGRTESGIDRLCKRRVFEMDSVSLSLFLSSFPRNSTRIAADSITAGKTKLKSCESNDVTRNHPFSLRMEFPANVTDEFHVVQLTNYVSVALKIVRLRRSRTPRTTERPRRSIGQDATSWLIVASSCSEFGEQRRIAKKRKKERKHYRATRSRAFATGPILELGSSLQSGSLFEKLGRIDVSTMGRRKGLKKFRRAG